MSLEMLEPGFTLDTESLRHRLGIDVGTLSRLLQQARDLARPVGYYCLIPNHATDVTNIADAGAPPLDSASAGCEHIVLCLVTLGSALDEAVAACFAQKNSADGYLLDRLGSEILFSASYTMNLSVAAKLNEAGFHLSAARYPGDDDLDLMHQHLLLREMQKHGDIPVGVNDHAMLTPLKSMLYFFAAAARPFPCDDADSLLREGIHRCIRCGRPDCSFAFLLPAHNADTNEYD